MSDRETFRQIEKIREANFRLLRLFSMYINYRADFITPDMINEVANIGGFEKEEAFLMLFSEACGVHPTDDGEDAAFFRDYFAPSVRRLDPDKYRLDPYYRNIHFPNVINGRWELRNDAFKPYQTFIWDDVRPDGTLKELPPLGYFEDVFSYPVVLEDGREWMLVTPNEIETIRPAVRAAFGHVVTFGLGLGYFPYMVSEKQDVDRIVIVEKDPAVIRLFREYILPQFTYPEKISIVNDDAFVYMDKSMPKERFDFAYADIWHDAGDGVPYYLRFNKYEERFPWTEFQYWIEETMLSYLRWYYFDHMGTDVRDPYLWLSNINTKKRAKSLTAEEWENRETE